MTDTSSGRDSDTSSGSDSENEYDTQDINFPEAAEEAERNLAVSEALAEPLSEPLAEPLSEPLSETGPIDVTSRAEYRRQIHVLSASVLTLRSRIKLLKMENNRLRIRNAFLSGAFPMPPTGLVSMRW